MSNSTQKIRIGVIGCGMIGKKHIANYQEIPEAEVVAIADLDQDEAKRVAQLHSIPSVFSDYKELLARDDIDAVDVCLHNQLHRPVTEAALEAGKDVYCEKPIAATYKDGLSMVETAKKTGRKLHIQTSTIYDPATRAAKHLIDRGDLGEIYYGRSIMSFYRNRPFVDGYGTPAFVSKKTAGGGALIDWGIYSICQTLFLMGNPKPARISGRIYNKIAINEQRARESGYDVEEMGAGMVYFENGAMLDVFAAWAAYRNRDTGSWVLGSKGGIQLPPLANGAVPNEAKWIHSAGDTEVVSTIGHGHAVRRWNLIDGTEPYYASPQKHWIAALTGKVDLLPSAELALNMILIADGIYTSHEKGTEVTPQDLL